MKRLSLLLLLFALVLPASAQFGRDPLTPKEVDDLRDSRQDPVTRLKLYVQYARQRMDLIEHLRTDPRLAENRGPRIHDALQDLGKIVEELDDNVEMFAKDNFDIRKPLKDVVAADSEFHQKLTALRDAANTDPALGEELRKHYQFVLDDTVESVRACLDSSRQTLQEQEEIAHDKTRKNQLRKPDEGDVRH